MSVLLTTDSATSFLIYPATVVGYLGVDSGILGLCAADAPTNNTVKEHTRIVFVVNEVTDDWTAAVTLFKDKKQNSRDL